jgi:RNA polymerase sigma-70 factor (ECF subfamily)
MNMITDLNNDNFSQIYLKYYPRLILFAKEYVISEEDAENIVQDVFLSLWENRNIPHTIVNLDAYLFKLIKNRSIDFLRVKLSERNRYQTIQNSFESELRLKLNSLESFDSYYMNEENIEKIVAEIIHSLPEKCREIFVLSRFEQLKHKEIAQKLNISVNTVENQIGIAIKKLYVSLKKYFPLYFLFIFL